MPVHDWTRVADGVFHDFHLAWIAEIRRVLNAGLLPHGYYAMADYVEPVAVGQSLPAMPLFLTPDGYIEVPLEDTYQAAYAGVPQFYEDVLS